MTHQFARRRLFQESFPTFKPTIFVDCKDVLIEDRRYLRDPDELVLFPGGNSLLRDAKRLGCSVVVITNQSDIARGYFTWEDYDRVTDWHLFLLGDSAPLAGIYANGYRSAAGSNNCLKPDPAMLQVASLAFNLDIARSILFGDCLIALLARARAGLFSLFHVLSGHGSREGLSVLQWGIEADIQNWTFQPMPLNSLLDFPIQLFQVNS